MTTPDRTSPPPTARIFPRVLAFVLIWQSLQFAGGLLSFVSLWPVAKAGFDGMSSPAIRSDIIRGHASVFFLAHLPAGVLLALLLHPLVSIWSAPRPSTWSVAWRTFLLCSLTALIASASMVQFKPWLMQGMDANHWYFSLQQLAPDWLRNRTLPFLLRALPITAAAFSASWYLVRALRRIRPSWSDGTNAATASALVAASFGALQLASTPLPDDSPTPARTPARPNVLVIASDSLRADFTGPDSTDTVAPTLRHMADKGVSFRQCFAPINGSVPGMASLLTGQYPHTHGLRHDFPSPSDISPASSPGLALTLRNHGYETAVLGDAGAGMFDSLPLGFDSIETADGGCARALLSESLCAAHPILPLWLLSPLGRSLLPTLARSAPLVSPESITDRVVQRLDSRPADAPPFFWTVYYSCTRLPFTNSPRQLRRNGLNHQLGSLGFNPDTWIQHLAANPNASPLSPRDKEFVRALYAGGINRLDDCVSRVIAKLRDSGAWDHTIVLVTGDHGVELLENLRSLGTGSSCTGEESLHVPAILHLPGNSTPAAIPHLVRTIDFAPTLLDLCGLPSSPSMEGVSLKPYVAGTPSLGLAAFSESAQLFPLRSIAGESPLASPPAEIPVTATPSPDGRFALKPQFSAPALQHKERTLRTEHWKLVFTPGQRFDIVRLYDLRNDPTCTTNVAPLYPEIFSSMKEKLWSWMRDHHDSRIPEIFPNGEPTPKPARPS